MQKVVRANQVEPKANKKKQTKDKNPSFNISSIMEIRPKQTMSAYLFFSTERLRNIKKGKNQQLPDIVKGIAAEWKTLSAAKKKTYEKLEAKDKQRYEKEKQEYEQQGYFINSDGVKSNSVLPKKPKFLDHIKLPKKAMPPYCCFNTEMIKKIKAKIPDLNITTISKKVSEQWSGLNEKERNKYHNQAELEKIRYARELKELTTQGYFVMADGTKSSDLNKKLKKAQSKQSQKSTQKNSQVSEKKLGKRTKNSQSSNKIVTKQAPPKKRQRKE